jgi:hypothetical protein
VRTKVVPSRKKKALQSEVRKHVEAGSALYSDALLSYCWSLLKRTISGTYVSVEPYHLFRYLDEQAYRFNNRKDMGDFDRFRLAMSQVVGKRLTWDSLTGKGLDLQTRLPK